MSITKQLTQSMRQMMSQNTKGYTTTATVTRIDGDTAWVHIPGGVDETPVRMGINAREGETVSVRVEDGTAWVTGNATSPPTDDRTARALAASITATLDAAVKRIYRGLDGLNTLIRESAAGIEVGKVDAKGDYVAGHALVNAENNSFDVLDENGDTMASFGKTVSITTHDEEEDDLLPGNKIVKDSSFEIENGTISLKAEEDHVERGAVTGTTQSWFNVGSGGVNMGIPNGSAFAFTLATVIDHLHQFLFVVSGTGEVRAKTYKLLDFSPIWSVETMEYETGSIPAGDVKTLVASLTDSDSLKRLAGVAGIKVKGSDYTACQILDWWIDGDDLNVRIRNVGSTAKAFTLDISGLCIVT